MQGNFLEKMRLVLLENECSGDQSLAYRFSDADGVRTGRSGYSFGVCQFDIENNWDAILLLRDCGFKPKDLNRLYDQDTNVDDLNAKLFKHQLTVDAWDDGHIAESTGWCDGLVFNVACSDSTRAMLVDYHNQLRFDKNGKLHKYIKWFTSAGGELTPEVIRDFKLEHTEWGRKRKNDVERRYRNVIKVFGE